MYKYILFLAAFVLAPVALGSPQLKVEDFQGKFGSLYFHGPVCTWEKCVIPELYQAHFLGLSVLESERVLKVEFIHASEEKQILKPISIPLSNLKYYHQEGFGIDHDGFEMRAFVGEEETNGETSKEIDGTQSKIFRAPIIEIRLAHWPKEKGSQEFRFGVELDLGIVFIKRIYLPDGSFLSESILPNSTKEVSNQYIRDTQPQAPNF